MAHEPLHLVLAPGEQVEEQAEGRASVVGAAVFAIDVVGQDQRLDLLRLVVPVEELAEAAGQERHHLGDLAAADAPEALRDAKQLAKALEASRSRVGRGLEEERLQVAGQPLQLGDRKSVV